MVYFNRKMKLITLNMSNIRKYASAFLVMFNGGQFEHA